MSTTTQQNEVRTLYAKVQTQKAEIASAERGTFVTNGDFRYSNGGQSFQIQTIRHLNQLQEIAAFLVGKQKDYAEAGKLLGIDTEFTWMGATFNQWINDLKVRAVQVELVNRKEKLAKLESKLLRIASPEFLAELELEAIKAELA